MLLGALAAAHGIDLRQERHGALVGEGRICGRRCLLALPQGFMNRSGDPVRRILSFFSLDASALVVAHDDMDLPLGRLRLRRGGGAGGHRGIASILESLGDDGFVRLKVGVGRPPEGLPAEAYVLQPFAAAEQTAVLDAVDRGVEAIELLLARGPEAAMNLCNRTPP